MKGIGREGKATLFGKRTGGAGRNVRSQAEIEGKGSDTWELGLGRVVTRRLKEGLMLEKVRIIDVEIKRPAVED